MLLPVLGLALLAFVLSLGVRTALMPLGTGNADEAVYVYQAHLLQEGRVTISAADHDPFFRPWLTGERDGRFFFQYGPGWPLVLAFSDLLGSMAVGVALCFAALVVVVHFLALEALGSRRTALLAAAFTALSPMLVWQSAMYLGYLFTALLLTVALFAALRSTTASSWVWPIVIGIALGLSFLTRPFDAALGVGLIVLATLVVGDHKKVRRMISQGLVAAVAGSPFLLAALVYNRSVTGSFTQFPLMAGDPMNRFGFGERRMQVGTPITEYAPAVAWESLVDNLTGGIGWVFGGFLALVLAAWALLATERRAQRLVLLAMFAAFPLGYFFWWASALSAAGATNGIGPHYYVPAFVPIAILSADGLWRLRLRNAAAASVTIGLMAAVTGYNIVDKVNDARWVTDIYRDVDSALPDLDGALVFLRTPEPTDFLMMQFPFLANSADLDNRVLYAVDRGPENGRLILSRPGLQAFLLHQQLRPEDDIFSPRWEVTPLWTERNSDMSVRVHLPPDGTTLDLYAASAGTRIGYTVEGPPSADQLIRVDLGVGEDCIDDQLQLCLAPGETTVVVGVQRPDTGERWERHYEVLMEGSGSYLVVGPGTGRHVIDFGSGPVTLRADVSNVIADASRP
jgi:hypothetical protein